MKLNFAFTLAVVAGCVVSPLSRVEAADKNTVTTITALPFTEASADDRYAPLADAIGDILMAQLSQVEGLAFVERTAIDKVLKELELTAAIDAADQTRLGNALGAQFVLTGSLTSSGDSMQLAAHLLEVSTARVARSARVAARADDLAGAVNKLARELVAQFSGTLPELSPEQIDQSPDANLHFMRGLGYYFAGMPEHATTQFLMTMTIDPGHAEARFYCGMNYFERDEFGHAKIEFTRFLNAFGDHELVSLAKEKLQSCETALKTPAPGGQP